MASDVPRVIGIDLGTTNCCLAICGPQGIRVLEVDNDRTMPSFVAFANGKSLVGHKAKNQVARAPECCVFDAKRLVGRLFTDEVVQKDIQNMHWPFAIEHGPGAKPVIRVRAKGQGGYDELSYSPERVSGVVLERLKEVAEAALKGKVEGTVITVPAYFSGSQRQATKVAAAYARLPNVTLLNEPTAAALAYVDMHQPTATGDSRNVLIFDLGGGTFDVSLVTVEPGQGGDPQPNVTVLQTAGEDHLGGEDFDNNLVNRIADHVLQTYGHDIRSNQRSMLRLRMACEDTKIHLSTHESDGIYMNDLWPGQGSEPFHYEVTRQEFEAINEDLFRTCMETVGSTLDKAEMGVHDITDVVLVGGSTQIPRVRELLQQMFPDAQIRDRVNPDEVVAYGAAVHAALLNNVDIVNISRVKDITNLSLGIQVYGDRMSVIIPRESQLPTEASMTYATTYDGQNFAEVVVYEGEDKTASRNRLLGRFMVTGLPPAPAGQERVDVRFEMNEENILNVTASGSHGVVNVTFHPAGESPSSQQSSTSFAPSGYEAANAQQPPPQYIPQYTSQTSNTWAPPGVPGDVLQPPHAMGQPPQAGLNRTSPHDNAGALYPPQYGQPAATLAPGSFSAGGKLQKFFSKLGSRK